jgi:WD40 repeat protein
LIQVLDTASLKSEIVLLPTVARSVGISADGQQLFVGSASDGVVVLEAPYGPILETIPTGAPVSDLVVTPNGRKLFAAMAHRGVRSFDRKRRTWRQLTWQGCPELVSMDKLGKFLVVSYQCGGPGGREGHDAVEVIEVASERSIHVLNGLPLVGGRHIFSPDGSRLFLDGRDACETALYDHEGCPSVPSAIGHLISVPDWKVLRTIGFPEKSVGTASFLPDGWRALTAQRMLGVYDFRSYQMLEQYTELRLVYWGGVVSTDGNRAYFARHSSRDLVILDAEDAGCAEMPTGLVSLLTGDGIPGDVIESQSIQPPSAVPYAPGFVGQAFAINATATKPRIEWKSHLLFGFAESTLTLYIKPVASGPILHWLDDTTRNQWSLTLLDGGYLEFDMRWGSGWHASLRSASPIPVNAWTHAAVTATREQITLFVNGVRQASAPFPSDPPRGYARYIDLGWHPDTTGGFQGLVDEIAFWARALRPEEVQALYQKRVQPPCRAVT